METFSGQKKGGLDLFAEHIRGHGKECKAWIIYFREKEIGGDGMMLGTTPGVDC